MLKEESTHIESSPMETTRSNESRQREQTKRRRGMGEREGETEEEIFKNGAEHATKDHGMKPEDITPQFKEKLRGLIRNS